MEQLSLTPADATALIAARARALPGPSRVAIGIAGGPGAGKSTIATDVVSTLGPVAAYVPMDGFHMRHAKLESLGTAKDKGAPHTFEGAAFADFLARLKSATTDVPGPGYSRAIEDVVDDQFVVPSSAKILIVEGNYILLANSPWWRIRPLLDLAVFIGLDREIVRARLLKRHAEHGLFTEERNRAHIDSVDLPNYDLVQRSRGRADIAIDLITDR